MTSGALRTLAIITVFCTAAPAAAQQAERLYVIECGQGHAPNQARWSPGVNEGKPLEMVTNCFLINFDKEKSVASMQRIADTLAQSKAQLWIHHDKAQSDAAKKSLQFYD
jgi:hypothetical protein